MCEFLDIPQLTDMYLPKIYFWGGKFVCTSKFQMAAVYSCKYK